VVKRPAVDTVTMRRTLTWLLRRLGEFLRIKREETIAEHMETIR